MNKKLSLTNIVLSPNGGALQFAEPAEKAEPGKPQKPGITVAVRFPTAKEAAAFDQGEEYTITITKTKK